MKKTVSDSNGFHADDNDILFYPQKWYFINAWFILALLYLYTNE